MLWHVSALCSFLWLSSILFYEYNIIHIYQLMNNYWDCFCFGDIKKCLVCFAHFLFFVHHALYSTVFVSSLPSSTLLILKRVLWTFYCVSQRTETYFLKITWKYLFHFVKNYFISYLFGVSYFIHVNFVTCFKILLSRFVLKVNLLRLFIWPPGASAAVHGVSTWGMQTLHCVRMCTCGGRVAWPVIESGPLHREHGVSAPGLPGMLLRGILLTFSLSLVLFSLVVSQLPPSGFPEILSLEPELTVGLRVPVSPMAHHFSQVNPPGPSIFTNSSWWDPFWYFATSGVFLVSLEIQFFSASRYFQFWSLALCWLLLYFTFWVLFLLWFN